MDRTILHPAATTAHYEVLAELQARHRAEVAELEAEIAAWRQMYVEAVRRAC